MAEQWPTINGHTPLPWTLEPHSDDEEGPLSVVSEFEENEHGGRSANWIAEVDLQTDVPQNHANAVERKGGASSARLGRSTVEHRNPEACSNSR